MRKVLAFFVTILAAAAVLVVAVVAVAPSAGTISGVAEGVPEDLDLAALDRYAVRSEVFASDGSLLATLHGPENREPVTLDKVPQPVIDAILAVEDADFYTHNGVNFRGMVRALFENVSAGGVEQGGSTITQQLVKKALLTDDRVLDRKTREIPLALRVETQLSKDEILEKYLNTVYFGSGAYGVQAAAETYWGRDVGELGYSEAAMLAALIANPVQYDPTLHPERAYQQRREALTRMVSEHMITETEAKEHSSAPLPVRRCDSGVTAISCGEVEPLPPDDYFVEEVKQLLLDDPLLGETREDRTNALFSGGLRIYTTLDPRMQEEAEKAQREGVPANDKGITSAMVTVDNYSGAVRALVGGSGYQYSQYNIATDEPGRQTGSTFKLFTLLTALEQGNLPIDYVSGGQSFPNPFGAPDPYKVDGPGGTLTSVTQKSSNGAFVRLEQIVGLNSVIDTAERLGVTTDLQPDLSLTLGTASVPLIEMASAYATVANGGNHNKAYFIDRVEDREGEVLYQHELTPTAQLSPNTACLATEILADNVKSGTGTRARLLYMPSAGKTGTTDANTDALFVGFTPYITTAIWMGNPENNKVSMVNLNGVANFGGTYPAMMWKAFNDPANAPFDIVGFSTCEPFSRGSRNVTGMGGSKLNEGREEPRSFGSGTTTTTAQGPSPTTVPDVAPPPTTTTSPTTDQDPGGGDDEDDGGDDEDDDEPGNGDGRNGPRMTEGNENMEMTQ